MEGRPDLFGERHPDLAARLAAWTADARADEAAASRSREAFLRRAAGEDASFGGVLLDLAERGDPVLVVTTAGRRHQGRVGVVGSDFAALRPAVGHDVLLAFAGIASVRTERRAPALGDRPAAVPVDLVDALALLAEDRPRVLVVPLAGDALAGELRSVGRDVLTVALDGAAVAYVAAANVGEVALA